MVERKFGDFATDVQIRGEGPIVVLIHGSVSDARTWDAQKGPLSERAEVVTYSRRFHWPNEPATDTTTYSMGEQVDDLIQLISSLDHRPVSLVGHSYGGFIALNTTLRGPDLVERQVLIEPPVVQLYLSDPPKPGEVLRLLGTKPRLGLALLKFGATGLVPATKAASKNEMDNAIQILVRALR